MPDSAEVRLLTETVRELNANLRSETAAVESLRGEVEELQDQIPDLVTREEATKRERVTRRVLAGVVLAGILIATFVWWDRSITAANRQRDQLASASRAYANCVGVNRAFEGVDIGYTYLAALSYANQDTDEGRERIKRAHDALRSGLHRTDCSGHLKSLSSEDAQAVVAEASRTLPTLPLPPPPTLAR